MSDHPASKETLVDPTSELNSQEQTLDTFEMSTTETVVDLSAQWATQYANAVIDPSEVASPTVDESLLYYQADCTEETSDAPVEVQSELSVEPVQVEVAELEQPIQDPPALQEQSVASAPEVVAESQPEPQPVVEPEPVVSQPTLESVVQPEPVAQPEAVAQPEPVVQSEPVVQQELVEEQQPVASPEPIAQPEPIVQQVPVAEPEPVAQPEPVAAAAPVAAAVPAAEVVAVPKQELDVKPVEPVAQPVAPVREETNPPAQSSESAKAEVSPQSNEPAEPAEPLFRDLDLRKEVQKAVAASGYDKPTPIQAEIIPYMLDGRDVLAQSQTGTGKTAAFALPILSRVDVRNRRPQVLVLAPTRELAIQVARSFTKYGADLEGFQVAAIYGGQDYEPQLRQLRRGVQVVVGTPGRVIDHVKRGTLDLGSLDCLVLDEADEMLNMGFLEDVQFVLEKTPDGRQVALFSATLPKPIRKIADEYLNDPARITIKSKTITAASVRQRALFVSPRDKTDALARLLEVEDTDGVIVFTKTKDSTLSVAEKLSQQGFSAVALNGDMPQKVRERTIDQLKRGQLDVLVATDVAARGLDVPRISHVFNYDLPHDSESYVHRIGRTGRAGRSGEAIIFLTNAQRRQLRFIENTTKQPIEVVDLPTVADINNARVRRFKQRITDVSADQDLTVFKDMIAQYAEETGKSMDMIAAALAEMSQDGRPFLLKERPKKQRERPERDNSRGRDSFDSNDRSGNRGSFGDDRPRRPKGRPLTPVKEGMTRYRLDVGWQDGVKPGNIVGAVANEAGIDGEFIGPINIRDSHTLIDLPEGMPSDIYQTLRKTWVAGKRLNLEEAGDVVDDNEGDGARSNFRKNKFSGGGDSRGKSFSGGKRSFGNKSRNNGSTAPSAKRGKKKFKPS
ncbi:DEAD-box ATP-dependent RNA helicase CshA [Rhodopirellula islandica]|uniref:ATP-dependent RNA helicase DeaD n=1 Tax=Rhodopirellula islandica TaxID=595434 RepID=A0A0J1EC64_RHOIS|nr:DEAD/DEAH box helicase [Rhodopirellula islandica]KLU03214.1 DEAD-box ATP-dependent RNA helicase CshA [Rhodopirellula islandica]